MRKLTILLTLVLALVAVMTSASPVANGADDQCERWTQNCKDAAVDAYMMCVVMGGSHQLCMADMNRMWNMCMEGTGCPYKQL